MESILYQLESCCFILVSNRPKTMSHISSRKKYTPPPPSPLQRTELLECIMSKILHTNLSTLVYIKMCNFFFWNFTLEISMRIICTPEHFLFIWSNLHNETKICNWTTPYSQFYETWRINQGKIFAKLHASLQSSVDVSLSVTQLESRRSSTITIENQLHFYEYFYNKMTYMKNVCLGFVKVLSTQ